MKLQKATIEILESAAVDESRGLPRSFTVQFNPTEYSLTKAAKIKETNVKGLDSPILQFVHGLNEKLTLDLFFDTTREGGTGSGARDVRELVRPVYQLVKMQPKTHRPPKIRFHWGSLSFQAITDTVTRKFTLFNPDGLPLRATVSVVFREHKSAAEQQRELNLQSVDHTRAYQVRRGDTLESIAAVHYGNPGEWRRIADANSRQLPLVRRLRPGTQLVIPPVLEGASNPGGNP